MAGVSSRTRSKNATHFQSLPLDGRSRSSRGKRGGSDLEDERRERRKTEKGVEEPVSVVSSSEGESEGAKGITGSGSGGAASGERVAEPGFVFLGEGVDKREWGSVSGSKRGRESVAENIEVIEIDASSDDDNGNEVEGLEHYEKKRFKGDVDDKKEEKSEEGGGSYVFGDKGGNFGNDDCGWGPANPITIDSDGASESGEEEHGVDESSSADDDVWSSTDGEDNETSDEDFQVEEGSESSSSEDSFSSSSSYVDEEEEEKKKDWRGRYGKVRKVEIQSSGICTKSGERKHKQVEEGELGKSPSSVNNDECGVQGQGEWNHAGSASVASSAIEMKGSSSKLHEGVEKQEAKRVKIKVENVSDDVEGVGDYQKGSGCSRPFEDEAHKGKKKQDSFRGHQSVPVLGERGDSTEVKKSERNNANANANANDRVNLDSHEGKERHGRGLGVTSVSSLPKNQEKMGDSADHKIMENKRREHKDWINTSNRERKAWVDNKTGHREGYHNKVQRPYRSKELRLLELVAECYLGKKNSIKGDSNGLEEKDDDDDVHQLDSQPPDCRETRPLRWGQKKVEPLKKSKYEEELDALWEEMERALREIEIDSQVGNLGTNEATQNMGSPTSLCKHNLYLDEEIGIYCKWCGWVAIEIKSIPEPVADRFPHEGSGKKVSSGGVNVPLFDGAQFNVSGGDSESEAVFSHSKGTVWDLIPDTKQSLYPHQQEGIEFIWKNLAGNIELHKCKSADPCSEGGCIISHAPGTGKTRLTMVFLQTYLQVFPKCLPVIIAPASLLLTWEDEFKKWDIGIPFHNLNNRELSGKEHVDATNIVDWSRTPQQNKDATRMVKLYSWFKEKSILGISYHLYVQLAGEKSKDDAEAGKKNGNLRKEKKHASVKENNENGVMGKVLREVPGLLVLDEGHTPRNQRSLIWKVLSEIQTRKRIILSGTPFQNNFLELYNTLSLVKPSFPDMIPPELKNFCQNRLMQENKASKELTWENTAANPADDKINQLKSLMDSFVHVHKGSILQKNLPGLRDCVLALKPDSLQKEILDSIDCSQNTLKFEHKLALACVHPSLFLKCTLLEKEESVIDRDQLEKLRLNACAGVKTRFLVEFVRLCEAVDEKVLVFSQFIPPLRLIIDQLKSVFNWSEGKEVLYMDGKVDQKLKQFIIHRFNDENGQAKILLASTRTCSEGINLVGASRVVLLDVVWNPSVERQAISRAYRLGQKRVVFTYHLITQGTTECTKYCKQAEKDRLSELVFSDRNAENDDMPKGCAVNLEDEVLDRMVRHDKLKDMFGECVVQPKERDLFESFGS